MQGVLPHSDLHYETLTASSFFWENKRSRQMMQCTILSFGPIILFVQIVLLMMSLLYVIFFFSLLWEKAACSSVGFSEMFWPVFLIHKTLWFRFGIYKPVSHNVFLHYFVLDINWNSVNSTVFINAYSHLREKLWQNSSSVVFSGHRRLECVLLQSASYFSWNETCCIILWDEEHGGLLFPLVFCALEESCPDPCLASYFDFF